MDNKTFILSDGSKVNAHGFRVDLSGLDIERFKSNPVMLFCHRQEEIIGRWENIRIEEDKLLAEANFDMEDGRGKEISRKVEKGYLKGCSMGIRIERLSDTDSGIVATRSEALEASIVAVPSDAGAVVLYDGNNNVVNLEAVLKNFKNNLNAKMMENNFAGAENFSPLPEAAKDRRIANLEAELKTAKESLRNLERIRITTLVDNAISDKKIGEDERETYVRLAEKDYDGVKKILERMHGVSPISRQLNVQGVAAKYDGKSWDELDKAGLLSALRSEAPEMYNRLYKEKFINHLSPGPSPQGRGADSQ
jgi:HK97 family phage prohead protease